MNPLQGSQCAQTSWVLFPISCKTQNFSFLSKHPGYRSKFVTFSPSLKRSDSKSFKSSSYKKRFSSLYVVSKSFFDECFLFYVTTGRCCFFINVYRSDFFSTDLLLLSCFERRMCFICYLRNNSTVPVPTSHD